MEVLRVKRKYACAFVVVIVASTLFWYAFRRDHDLEAREHAMCSTIGWLPNDEAYPAYPSYGWLNDHELIACQNIAGHNTLVRIDVRSRRTSAVAQLVDRNGIDLPGIENGWRLSPDGSTVVWHCSKSYMQPYYWLIQRLGATGPEKRRVGKYDISDNTISWTWLADSRRWMWFDEENYNYTGTHARIYNLDAGVREIATAVINPARSLWGNGPTQILGVTTENAVVSTSFGADPVSKMYLLSFQVDHPSRPAEIKSVILPFSTFILEAALSSKTDRLAWCLYHEVLPPVPVELLNRLLHRKSQPESRAEIWVSNLDGGAMRKVGQVVLRDDSHGRTANYPRSLRWLPDGKQLSFIMKDELRVIGTD